MSLPPALTAYRLATQVLAPLAPQLLVSRARGGKEDPARLAERLGTASADRPAGLLVWLHGASVGESQLGLALAARLRAERPDIAFLHTSGTVTSAEVIARRLGPNDRHAYVPVDTPAAVAGFLDAWRPDLGICLEGELWPNLLQAAAARRIPLALANARMTARSLRGWGRTPAAARHILGLFAAILPADAGTRDGLMQLTGHELPPAGNLKLAATVPQPDPAQLAQLAPALSGRPVWLAASTHAGEEELVLAAHQSLMAGAPDALLILAPRHPDRAQEVEIAIRKAGFVPVRRSQDAVPQRGHGVWLWDTMGELGIAFALAPVTVMGGSLVEKVGGHNPVEPIAIGSAVISGMKVHNFADLYLDLEAAGGVVLVGAEPQGVALAVAGLLGQPDQRAAMLAHARAVVAEGAAAMDRAVAALVPLIPQVRP